MNATTQGDRRGYRTATEVADIMYEQGVRVVRSRGSHFAMQKVTPEGPITVPIPNDDPIADGTLASIIRQSKLPKELFEVDRKKGKQ